MKLYYWNKIPGLNNFGDHLSAWIWHKELPGCFDDNGNTLFLGIGTILDNTVPIADQYIVMGSGAGYHSLLHLDDKWSIYAVRGPLTAKKYSLPIELAITDPAILLTKWFTPSNVKKVNKIGFIPHWSTLNNNWESVCEICGLQFINPTNPVEDVLSKVASVQKIISESLHGVIVADTLRIPWIAVQSDFGDFSSFKWDDWFMSMEIKQNHITRIFKPWSKPDLNKLDWKQAVKIVFGKINMLKVVKKLKHTIKNNDFTLSANSVVINKIEKYDICIKKLKQDLSM